MKLEFDPEADAAYFEISPASVVTTREIEPGILGDYDAAGHLVGLSAWRCSPSGRGLDCLNGMKRHNPSNRYVRSTGATSDAHQFIGFLGGDFQKILCPRAAIRFQR